MLSSIPTNDEYESERSNSNEEDSLSSLSSDLFQYSDNTSDDESMIEEETGECILYSSILNTVSDPPTKYEGIPDLIPQYSNAIKQVMKDVFKIESPKEWQLRLVQAMVFTKHKKLRIRCIRRTGDGKSLPIYTTATMTRGITLIIMPLLALGADQSSSVMSMDDVSANVFAEHLDSVSDPVDIASIHRFVNNMSDETSKNISLLLFMSPDAINNTRWIAMFNNMKKKNLVKSLIFDEAHYIALSGRHFRPNYYSNSRYIVSLFWNEAHMLFTSATLNSQSLTYITLMLHPSSPWKNSSMFNRFCGLDIPGIPLPNLQQNSEPFWNALIWGSIFRDNINVVITYSNNWLKSTASNIKYFCSKGCKFLVYCSSANDAREKVSGTLHDYFMENSLPRDVVTLVGNDGIIMKSYLVDCFSGRIISTACNIAGLVGTNAINCGINSSELYYIILKGFPRSITELFQLLGRLGRTSKRAHQDMIEIVVSLPSFLNVYFSVLNSDNQREKARLMMELRTVSQLIMTPRQCIQQYFSVYYGHTNIPTIAPCRTRCPFCRCDIGRKINKEFLIDFMEATVFENGPVRPAVLASKLLSRKGSVFSENGSTAKASDMH